MNEVANEEALLKSAKAGDHGALEALLRRHEARIYGFGKKLCGDAEEAKEILQETMLSVARGIEGYRGEASLPTWLYTIARSHCIKRRRRKKGAPDRERSLEGEVAKEAAALADGGRAPDEAAANREVAALLEKAISRLDPLYRDVLVLRDVEGLTAPETAAVVGASPQAVKSRLHRARMALREELAPVLGRILPGATPSCPDVLERFSQQLDGEGSEELSAEVCAEMERHLEECGRCRGTCASLKRTLALCRTSAAEVEVPRAVQASVKVALRDFLSSPSFDS